MLSPDLAELLVLEHKMTPIHSDIKETARLVRVFLLAAFLGPACLAIGDFSEFCVLQGCFHKLID